MFPFLDSEANLEVPTFSQDLQAETAYMGRVSTPMYTDQAPLQESLEGQDFSATVAETIPENGEKYGKSSTNLVLSRLEEVLRYYDQPV